MACLRCVRLVAVQVARFLTRRELSLGGPAILSQPHFAAVCPGTSATFSITATQEPALSYRWQRDTGGGFVDLVDGANISGATTATLMLFPTSTSDGANYRCVVQNDCGSAISFAAMLNIGLSGDTNRDGIVDLADLGAVLAQYGHTCP